MTYKRSFYEILIVYRSQYLFAFYKEDFIPICYMHK